MKKTTHLLAGGIIFACFLKLDPSNIPYYWASLLGAYAPDLDALPFLMSYHRKLCHNVLFLSLGVLTLYALFMPLVVLQLFFLGFVSHIILDSMTVSGINVIRPFGELWIRGPFHTGDAFDVFLGVVLGLLAGLVVLY